MSCIDVSALIIETPSPALPARGREVSEDVSALIIETPSPALRKGEGGVRE